MLRKGRFTARFAAGEADLRAAQALRHLCFFEAAGAPARPGRLDRDAFDPVCRHILVEADGREGPVCTFRLLPIPGGDQIGRSYAAQFYGLEHLRAYVGPMVELGRFCVHPEAREADVLRIAWGAMAAFVDSSGVEMMFGCASFPGTRPDAYREAFDLLAAGHLAPRRWRPGIKAPEVVRFAAPRGRPVDRRAALRRLPPLLKTYLAMGGWVSDHAVIDRDLNTLHVFTGLEIAAVPPARARALRAVSGQAARRSPVGGAAPVAAGAATPPGYFGSEEDGA